MQFSFKRPLMAAVVSAAALAAPSAAHAAQPKLVDVSPCDGSKLTQAFARWGDRSRYKLAPRGTFERGTAGWTLSRGATVEAGSEPWDVAGEDGVRALTLDQGETALSPSSCVNAGAPTFRFFARSTKGKLPVMRVELAYRSGLFGLLSLPIGFVTPQSEWKPSSIFLTLSVLPAALALRDVPLSLRFVAQSGSWQVDDVFIDPYTRG